MIQQKAFFVLNKKLTGASSKPIINLGHERKSDINEPSNGKVFLL